jgi:transposase
LAWGTSSVLSSDDCASPLAAPHSIYSPDFNPIEQLFAKLKALLRKAAARTQTALWETIGTLLDDFTPAECQNYIVHSGYEFV